MKNFFGSLLGTLAGILVSFFIIIIFFIVVINAVSRGGDKPVEVKPNNILYINLTRQVVDRQPSEMPSVFQQLVPETRIGLNTLLKSIERAKDDPKIKGIFIEPDGIIAGVATIGEIREALADFKKSGKWVVVYGEVFTQSAYYLSSCASKIFYNPSGFFYLKGLSIRSTHYKSILDKLEIEPYVVKIGKYKSYGESYEFDHMSPANVEQSQRLVDKFWANIAEGIAADRAIPVDSLNHITDNLLIRVPTDALRFKLVDSLIYRGDVISYLKNITNTSGNKDLATISVLDYSKTIIPDNNSKNKVAVLYASGEIIPGNGLDGIIGGERFAREIREARKDSSIKAIVLRINSPGGSAMASETIFQELKNTKGIKPVVVSMGDMAASGGYYLACAGDTILANKNTLTGSIGVISVFFNAGKFFNTIGINFDEVKSHKNAGFNSMLKPPTDDEIAYWQQFTDYTYDMFISNVSENRNLNKEYVHEIGRGRVWGGEDAVDKKLADSFGGLSDAILVAAKMAGIENDYRIVELPKRQGSVNQILGQLYGEIKFNSVLKDFGIDEDTYIGLKLMVENQGTLARLPYAYSIK